MYRLYIVQEANNTILIVCITQIYGRDEKDSQTPYITVRD
jgi:hypothetical protein